MILGEENTQGHFSNAFYGHLWAFSLGARRSDAVFSVARLTVEISVGHGDMGNVCYQLKKSAFELSGGCKLLTITRRRNRFSCASPSAHATHWEKSARRCCVTL